MEHYRPYSPEQFALDKYFQEWVLTPNNRSNHDWQTFLERYPYKKAAIDDAMELVRLSGISTDENANRAYLESWQVINQNAARSKTSRKTYYNVAAAIIGFVIIAFAGYKFGFDTTETTLYTTGYGETKKIMLNDGTTITLNANSTMGVDQNNFNSEKREVMIYGDAFFEVVHTPQNTPFIVRTSDDAEVHVLGTAFNVNTRGEELKVYLQSGKIKLQKKEVEEILTPGDEAKIINGTETIAITKIANAKAEENLAWLKNQYVMNDVPLSVIIKDIQDTFGKIVIADDISLLSERVTAKVPANDLKVLTEVLSQALEIKIEQKENHLYIRKAEMH